MEIRQLRSFVAVAERGSFSGAAQWLGVTQPALSRQIGQLEQALSQRLFHRNGRGAAINTAGEVFLHHARAVLARLDDAQHELGALRETPQGEVRIGLSPSISATLLRPLIVTLASKYPCIKIHVEERFSDDLLQAGKFDLAVLYEDQRSGIALATNRRVIAPDTPGNGDTPALPGDAPTIYTLAAALVSFLDSIGLDQVDLYGFHTGADIAAEVAISAPHRARRLIQDGAGIFSADESAEFLEHYAHPFPPDLEGAYLQRAFTFCHDRYFFFP